MAAPSDSRSSAILFYCLILDDSPEFLIAPSPQHASPYRPTAGAITCERLQLSHRAIARVAVAVGPAIERPGMEHSKLPVRRGMHIDLHHVGTEPIVVYWGNLPPAARSAVDAA